MLLISNSVYLLTQLRLINLSSRICNIHHPHNVHYADFNKQNNSSRHARHQDIIGLHYTSY